MCREWFSVLNYSSFSPNQVILKVTGRPPLDWHVLQVVSFGFLVFSSPPTTQAYCPEFYFENEELSVYFSLVSISGKHILMEKTTFLFVCLFSYGICLPC